MNTSDGKEHDGKTDAYEIDEAKLFRALARICILHEMKSFWEKQYLPILIKITMHPLSEEDAENDRITRQWRKQYAAGQKKRGSQESD